MRTSLMIVGDALASIAIGKKIFPIVNAFLNKHTNTEIANEKRKGDNFLSFSWLLFIFFVF